MRVRRKRKFRKVYWLLAGFVAAAVSFALLLSHKPGYYNPTRVADDSLVSPYLTNVLYPDIYNGAQRQEPFDLVVIQKGINDIIARSEWPKESNGIGFSAPEVFFVPDSIVLMGTAVLKGVKFVVTIVVRPSIDEDGLLNLQVAKIKIGAVNMTFLAKAMAKRMYAQRLAATDTDIDADNLQAQIAASLLNDEPFEPVFKVKDKRVRVAKAAITHRKLMLHLIPAGD